MKTLILAVLCCIVLASCKPGQVVPPQAEEVYTCITPIMDETYMTLRADIEKALLNQSVEWLKDLETLAKKHGVQTISCILAVFLHPDAAKPVVSGVIAPAFPPTDVAKRAQEFLTVHKVTFNKK